MNKQEQEARIRQALTDKANGINENAVSFRKVQAAIYEKEQNEMKQGKFSFKNKKKAMIASFCCIALLSGSLIAGTIAKSWIGHGDHRYQTFPTAQKVQKDLGFLPNYVESLPGGFEFVFGGKDESSLVDEQGKSIVDTKGMSLSYAQPGSKDMLTLGVEQIPQQYMTYDHMQVLENTYKGYTFYFSEQMYKFVPADYVLTEEDKNAQAAGTLEISYGSDEVSVEQIQSIWWNDGDIRYYIMGSDFGFTADEMVEMAQAVIDAK